MKDLNTRFFFKVEQYIYDFWSEFQPNVHFFFTKNIAKKAFFAY